MNNDYRIPRFCVIVAWIVCIVCCLYFTLPRAAAAEVSTPWLDLMPYGGFMESIDSDYGTHMDFAAFAHQTSIYYFKMPEVLTTSFVDIIIYLGDGYQPDIKVGLERNDNGVITYQYLNQTKYGPYNNYIRCYGTVTNVPRADFLPLVITNDSQWTIYPTVLSFRMASQVPYQDVSCNWSIVDTDGVGSGSYPNGILATDWSTDLSTPTSLTISIPSSEWTKYGFLDFVLYLDVSQINTITATSTYDDGFIPVSYNYQDNDTYQLSYNMLSVSLDLSAVTPSNGSINLRIYFNTGAHSTNEFILYSVNGWSSQTYSETGYWFPRLLDILKNLFSTPPGGAAPAPSPDMNQNQGFISDSIGQIDSDLDAFATIPRPDLGSIDLPSDHLADINYDTNVAHLTMITHAQPFRLIFFFAALFMVVGVVIYGRRS